MSQKRPQHDRSKYLNDNENNCLIQLIEKEDGVVRYNNNNIIFIIFI
jgi:hypothetical protein